MRPTSRIHVLRPWWLGALGAVGLGACVAASDLPLAERERVFARAALVAGSAAGAAVLAPDLLLTTPEQLSRMPRSHQVGAAVGLGVSICASPLLGNQLIEACAEALAAKGMRRPRVRLGALVAAAALLGEFLQRFPSPPIPKTPPPKRRLGRPSAETIMRN